MSGDEEAIHLPNGEPMTFCRIPAGSFVMGSRDGHDDEQPEHRVILTKDYWLGKTPVTQKQFAAWNKDHENGFSGERELPVEQVTWKEALEYCQWVAGLLEKAPLAGLVGNLPTDAQWEYACRAGTDTDYHSGDGVAALAGVGWFDENSGGKTHPVGSLPGNEWGLQDMHGNVWEWCLDGYDAEAYAKHSGAEVEDPFVSGAMTPKEDPLIELYRRRVENLAKMRESPGEVDRGVIEGLWEVAKEIALSPTGAAWIAVRDATGHFLANDPLTDQQWQTLERLRDLYSDQVPKTDDPARVVRGGSWGDVARDCRAACRGGRAPGLRNWTLGFRVCLVSGPAFQP